MSIYSNPHYPFSGRYSQTVAIPPSVGMRRIHTSVVLRGVEEVKAPNFPDSVTEGDAKYVTIFCYDKLPLSS